MPIFHALQSQGREQGPWDHHDQHKPTVTCSLSLRLEMRLEPHESWGIWTCLSVWSLGTLSNRWGIAVGPATKSVCYTSTVLNSTLNFWWNQILRKHKSCSLEGRRIGLEETRDAKQTLMKSHLAQSVYTFSNLNVYMNHLGILLKCGFWFSWPRVEPWFGISSKLLGGADTAGV